MGGYIEAFLEAHGLASYFADYEHPGRTGLSKGENIRLVMERNGVRHGVYVGDAQVDLEGARFARIPFLWARYGFGSVTGYDASSRRSARASLFARFHALKAGRGRRPFP